MGLSEHSKSKRSVLCYCRQASCLAVLMGWNLLKEETICYYICCPSLYFSSCQKRLASKAALWDQILILSLTGTVCVYVCVCVKSLSRVRFFATPRTVALQAPLSMEISRQEWSGLPVLSPGDFPDPGIEPGSPALQADSLPSEPPGKPTVPVMLQII